MTEPMGRVAKIITRDHDNGPMYEVELWENGQLLQIRGLPKKSINFAQDLAENWTLGIVQIEENKQ